MRSTTTAPRSAHPHGSEADVTKPRRIQRKMLKGWRLPPQTVYVGRGSKWGNPFPFEHQRYLGKAWAVDAYAHWLATSLKGMALLRNHLHELRGKNLACWCRAGEPCHADLLLALANGAPPVAPERAHPVAAAEAHEKTAAPRS
jgi:hypothetical protein